MSAVPEAAAPAVQPIRLDIGCGSNKYQGDDGKTPFTGMDQYAMTGVDVVHDARVTPWPFADESVIQARSSHFLEHLTNPERVKFFNELYRVLAFGGTATIITPNWSHACAYGDPTHQWPPTSEWYALYLQKFWRVGGEVNGQKVPGNAPHADVTWNPDGYSCDFDPPASSGTWDPWLNVRNDETKVFWMQRGVNSCRDLIINLTKTKRV